MPKLTDLKPDPRNARNHGDRNREMIATSIQRNGFGRSLLLANDGTIIAGNATAEAAGMAGLANVRVIETTGDEVVALKRTDVAPGTKAFHELAEADNRTAQLAEINADELSALIDEGMIDAEWLYYEPELDRLLAGLIGGEPFDPAAEWVGMPEFHQEDERPAKQIVVNFQSEADVASFARLLEQQVTMATKSVWFPFRPRAYRKDVAYQVDAADVA